MTEAAGEGGLDVSAVGETAFITAMARAEETARVGGVIRDEHAAGFVALLGGRAVRLRRVLGSGGDVIVARTRVIDELLRDLVTVDGCDGVVNLGAGLDTRPYRLDFLSGCRFLEIDRESIIELKRRALGGVSPLALLSRRSCDLEGSAGVVSLIRQEMRGMGRGVVLAEGVLAYLARDRVEDLARGLAQCEGVRYLVADFVSGLTARQLEASAAVEETRIPFRGGVGVEAFELLGWRCREYFPLAREVLRLQRKGVSALGLGAWGGSSEGLPDGVAVLEVMA